MKKKLLIPAIGCIASAIIFSVNSKESGNRNLIFEENYLALADPPEGGYTGYAIFILTGSGLYVDSISGDASLNVGVSVGARLGSANSNGTGAGANAGINITGNVHASSHPEYQLNCWPNSGCYSYCEKSDWLEGNPPMPAGPNTGCN